MTRKTKIVVAGIGGVGGCFGGLLAKKYADAADVDIIFLARGEHLNHIQNKGLKVVHGESSFIAHPTLATDDTTVIGVADFILICTKNYDLVQTIEQLKPCIGQSTILLPLLNGVDSTERIKSLLPDTTVLQGCVYLVARLKQAGIIENTGNIQKLYFGIDGSDIALDTRLFFLEQLLKDAGIEATYSKDILPVIWEKFIFVSPLATATCFYNAAIGAVLAAYKHSITDLIDEIVQITTAKGITVDKDIAARTLEKMKALHYEATSSMHNDLKNNKPHTEVDSLTGFIVRAGQELNISTPVYTTMYNHLAAPKNGK